MHHGCSGTFQLDLQEIAYFQRKLKEAVGELRYMRCIGALSLSSICVSGSFYGNKISDFLRCNFKCVKQVVKKLPDRWDGGHLQDNKHATVYAWQPSSQVRLTHNLISNIFATKIEGCRTENFMAGIECISNKFER